MPKVTKSKKKNPILADEDTSKEEEKVEDTADEVESDTGSEKDEVEEKPAPKKAKEVPTAPAEKVNIANELNSDIARTKAIIEKEQKVMFMIPTSEGEKAGATHEVFVNGYKYVVKKGVMVEIPMTIFNILAEHYKITSEAGADFRVDLHKDKQDAL